MKKLTYTEQLKDPRWQKKRLEILNRDSFTCQLCGDTKTFLHVHHKIYCNSQPWDIDNVHLITCCEHCHKLLELIKNKDEWGIDLKNIFNILKKVGSDGSFTIMLFEDDHVSLISFDENMKFGSLMKFWRSTIQEMAEVFNNKNTF